MDYRDDTSEAAFRAELRSWIETHRPRDPEPQFGEARARFWERWHHALYEGGWMGLSWTTEYGGRGLPATYEAILNDEIGRAGAPPVPHVGFLGRAMLHFGSDEQRRRYLPALLSGEENWCQGFSEPGAGSDLAALATRGVMDGDDYVVDGQKVWTSDAAWADLCLLLLRTEPDAPRHRGISALVVPMDLPGITIQPILQIDGDAEFNEVFFDSVRVPRANVVGAPGQGWKIAMTTVAYERGPADVGFSSRYSRMIRELEDESRDLDLGQSRRQELARAYVHTEVLRLHVLRGLSGRVDDAPPGPEASISKLLATSTEQLLNHVAMDLHVAAALDDERPDVLRSYLYSRAASIAGGTSQIQRSLVAERLLDLPRSR